MYSDFTKPSFLTDTKVTTFTVPMFHALTLRRIESQFFFQSSLAH